MRNYRPLLIQDARQTLKDPMLMASLLGPLFVILFTRFAFQPLSDWIEQHYAFRLADYTEFIAAFLVITIPLLPGTMAGLLMLDERDENMIAYYAVTPLARKGYFVYRLFLPSLLSFALTALYYLFSGIADKELGSVYALLLLTLEAPCITLFLAAFAANKVEGLALSKLCGLLFAGPVITAFVPVPWQYAAALIPTFWPAKAYLADISGDPVVSTAAFMIGLALHVALLLSFVRAFLKRIE
ncbi:ABC transporter permease [Paenibacillus sp. KQZ6P-2]|uniref:ABC transporter permease n=1 Tax=Paenibacillus mangrovi TaxID=2931978 RepID=A0A9X2B4Z2_9BACL|nr:ABC transporter permease [Paenibacillus mangrovi]MCJ8012137.1 ABC transporter permease [Paenibacillus mangrovi]